MTYVEFPADRIVNVHWHKKNGNGGGDLEFTCGAFRHGYGLYDAIPRVNFGGIPGLGLFILDNFNIYSMGIDNNPNKDPLVPYSYWWHTADFLPLPFHDYHDVPFIWEAPRSWTLTVDSGELASRSGVALDSVYIQEYRNINPQAWAAGGAVGAVPDQVADGSIDIINQRDGEIYAPAFRVGMRWGRYDSIVAYPPTLVQAHCDLETIGDYPPGKRDNPYFVYPAPGRTDLPLRPPPSLF